MKRAIPGLIACALAVAPTPLSAQALTKCNIGEQVADNEGRTGIIVAANGEVCQLRYPDGQIRGWASWSLRPAAAAPPPAQAQDSIVLRGYSDHHRLVYRADSRGHFTVAVTVNGAPLHFLIDTGATLVFMTPADAQAAGLDPSALAYDQTANTGKGKVRIAPVILKEIQIGELSVERVPAAVIEGGGQSVLGMSFLARLKSFEIRNGALTIDW